MRKFLSLAWVCLSLLLPVTAQAALDAKGAKELQKSIEEALSWYTQVAKATGQGMIVKGAVEVEPAGQYYKARIFDVSILSPTGYRLQIGDVVVHASAGAAGEWLLSAALPSPMTLHDATGAAIADMMLGRQRFAAAWLPAENFIPRFDVEYGDLEIKPRPGAPLSLKIESLSAQQNLVKGSSGDWTGPVVWTLGKTNFAVKDGTQDSSIRFDKAAARATYEQLSLEGRAEEKKQILTLVSQFDAGVPEAQMRRLVTAIFDHSTDFPDAMTSTFEMEGLAVESKPGGGGAHDPSPPLKITSDKISADTFVKGIKREKGSAHLTTSLNNFRVEGLPPAFTALLPYIANIDIRLDNLPMKALTKAFMALAAVARGQADDPVQQQKTREDVLAAMKGLPQALAVSGATAVIKNTYFRAVDLNAALEGTVKANATSPLVGVGTMTLTMGGLDEMIQRNQSMSASSGAMRSAQMMIPVQMMGQLQKGADGKSLRVYKMEATPEGKLLLNGLDMTLAQALLDKGNNLGTKAGKP